MRNTVTDSYVPNGEFAPAFTPETQPRAELHDPSQYHFPEQRQAADVEQANFTNHPALQTNAETARATQLAMPAAEIHTGQPQAAEVAQPATPEALAYANDKDAFAGVVSDTVSMITVRAPYLDLPSRADYALAG